VASIIWHTGELLNNTYLTYLIGKQNTLFYFRTHFREHYFDFVDIESTTKDAAIEKLDRILKIINMNAVLEK